MLVICSCNVGFEGVKYPKGVPVDLPPEVVASLGGRAVPVPAGTSRLDAKAAAFLETLEAPEPKPKERKR
jgi:hypothetical protein